MNNVVVMVEGGLVQNVYATDPDEVNVVVVDYDQQPEESVEGEDEVCIFEQAVSGLWFLRALYGDSVEPLGHLGIEIPKEIDR